MRTLGYYSVFAVLALALHAWLLFPRPGQMAKPKSPEDLLREIAMTMKEIEKELPPLPEEPKPEPPKEEEQKPTPKEEPKPEPPKESPKPEPPPPPVKYTETPKEEPKKEEPKPVPPPPAPSPSPVPSPSPSPSPLPSPSPSPAPSPSPSPLPVPTFSPSPSPVPLPSPSVSPLPSPSPSPSPSPAPSPVSSPAPSPSPSPMAPSPSPSPAPRAAVSTLSEYRTYLAKELPASADYSYVPKIRFGDSTADENRAIMRYFGMELIAYPENQKFYVYIDPDQSLFSKSSDFEYMKNFSNRVIYRSSPFFEALGREAEKRHGLPANSLVVAQLLKPSSAGYFAWKEVEVARRAGAKIEDVALCEAAFARTAFGAWIVKIETLVMKDGSRRAVEDFEWTRVATGGGR